MRVALFTLSLLGAAAFALLLLSAILTTNPPAMVLATLGLAIALPFPGRMMVSAFGGWGTFVRGAVGVGLVVGTSFTILAHRPPSIYASNDVRAKFHALYDEKMQAWPLPFEDRFLDTEYGTVHIVVSGLEDGPPMLLLHASGVGSWSWRSNAAALEEWRLPADRLERDLARTIKAHLIACIECGKIAARDARSIVQLCSQVEALGDAVFECIDTVKLSDGTLTVDLNPGKIANALSISPDCIAPDALSLQSVFSQRLQGVETRLVIGASKPACDDILIANIARAEQWRTALCNGDDLATIAARDGITKKYLGQMLCFAFLSPKLVRAILEGRQPSALTTNWLRSHGLPMAWADQDRIVAQL